MPSPSPPRSEPWSCRLPWYESEQRACPRHPLHVVNPGRAVFHGRNCDSERVVHGLELAVDDIVEDLLAYNRVWPQSRRALILKVKLPTMHLHERFVRWRAGCVEVAAR